MGLLADYKWLHDLFQQLEDRYYLIYHDYRRLPADSSAWALIERNEPELQAIADELLERGARATVAADAAGWRQKLTRVRGELHDGVEASDVERLARAMTLLKDVLGRELSRINTRLVGTASTLRLTFTRTATGWDVADGAGAAASIAFSYSSKACSKEDASNIQDGIGCSPGSMLNWRRIRNSPTASSSP